MTLKVNDIEVSSVKVGDVNKYKDNWIATAPPDVDNDVDEGYGTGSMWLDTNASPRELYICRDAMGLLFGTRLHVRQ